MKKYIQFWLFIIVLMGVIFVFSLGSCTTTKNTTKEIIKYDSTAIKKSDSLSIEIHKIKTSFEKLKLEKSKTGVVFKDVPCPDVKIDSTCNRDSLLKLIRQQQDYIKSLKNTITVNADGSTKFQGQIAAYSADLERVEREANEQYSENVKLKSSNESLTIEVNKLKEKLDKVVKRKWFTGWTMWLLFFVIGFVVGKWGKQIINKLR